MSATAWLICGIAALGFAFDIYELLMMPLIAQPALAELLGVDPDTASGTNAILDWTGRIMWWSAACGGIFGLLGGYLTDRFGRRRVLVWSILLYAFSAAAAAYSTSPTMLLILRCTTFVGVCVEFVAAVAWLSELFPDPKQRERVLGYTQAFSSIGGLLVTFAYQLIVHYHDSFPAWMPFHGPGSVWRYTLMSGLLPALPLIVVRPFLPESPAWQAKRAAGTLKRPSVRELFRPEHARTTIVTAVLFACGYGAAFGALQLTPQIVPSLVPELRTLGKLKGQLDALRKEKEELGEDYRKTKEYERIKAQLDPLETRRKASVANVQLFQEVGGLAGRFALALLVVRIVSRRLLLWLFQVPGLLLIPLVYFTAAAGNLGPSSLEWLKWGIFLAGFFTVAQFSFWGNYLPRVYPVHLRGTGESFAANVGGRMVGTAANYVSTRLAPLLAAVMPGLDVLPGKRIAYAAAIVTLGVYGLGVVMTAFLPEPQREELPD
jgi:MFS family permease